MQLEGKAMLVTGAARGLGRAIAEMAAEEGARLAVSGRQPRWGRGRREGHSRTRR